MNITPVAFLVIKEGNVRVLPIAEPASTSLDRALDLLPELVDRIAGLLRDRKTSGAEEPGEE